MTEEGLQSITRFRDVGMIYKLKHIRNGVPDVNIGNDAKIASYPQNSSVGSDFPPNSYRRYQKTTQMNENQ